MERRTTAGLCSCLVLFVAACVGEISENGLGGAGASGTPAAGNGPSNGAGPSGPTAGPNAATSNATAANANAANASANGNGNSNGATTTDAAATSADAASSGNGMPTCGDAACNGGETCMTCMQDCGMCVGCGDGTCGGGETCDSCASDCGACPTCAGAGDATTALDAEEVAFIGLLNNYRAQNGLGAVASCTSMNRAAQGHSEDMRDQNYFDHQSLSGDSPWDRMCNACYEHGCGPSTAVAENIAAGNSGAQATFEQWRNSSGHNANMLGGSFTRIGIGRATGGGQYGVYWTNVFGGDDEPSCN